MPAALRNLIPVAVMLAASCGSDRPRGPSVEVSYMVDTVSAEHKDVLDLWRS